MFVVNHRIAGITFRTETDHRIECLHSEPFRRYAVDHGRFDVEYRFCSVDPRSLKLPPPDEQETGLISRCIRHPVVLDSPLLRSQRVRARLRACLDQPEQVGLELRPKAVTIYDFSRRRLDAFYTPVLNELLASSLMEVPMQKFFASFLPARGGVMVHSAGVVRYGAAALFLAPNGGGKTTIAERSANGAVLGDDQIILKREGEAIVAHGTPWGRRTAQDVGAKVGGLFLLEKGGGFKLSPIRPSDALAYFWREHLFYRVILPKQLRVSVFDLICQVCHQAPVYRMRFSKGFVDWDAIDAAMH